jgi:CelD/BcsL family acetyltransferase involved in cellulose biosynthesis
MRVWVAELDGVPIAVQVFVAAGGEVAYWNGGWDECHAPLRPGLVTILAAIEDAIGRGERRLDLGPVEYPYKLRLADGNAPLCWDGLIVPGPRSVLTVAQLAPLRARLSAREALRRGLAGERFERVLELKRRFGRRALVAAIAERAGGRARRRG